MDGKKHDYVAKARQLAQRFSEMAGETDRKALFPEAQLEMMHAAGLSELIVPPEYDGDAGAQDYPTVFEVMAEIASGDSNVAQCWFVHYVSGRKIYDRTLTVSEDTRRKLAREILQGARIGAAASEPGGRNLLDWSTLLQPAKGGVIVTGEKAFTTGHVGTRYILVYGHYEKKGDLRETLQLGLARTDDPGIKDHADWDNMGQRATASGRLSFEGVFIPQEMLLGRPGEAATDKQALLGLVNQASFSAIFLGIGMGALKAAVAYVNSTTRPWPTAKVERAVDDPYLQLRAGRIDTALQGARHLLLECARALVDVETGSRVRGEASVAVARARVATTEACLLATSEAFALMGARATSNRYGFDRYWRNARTLTLHDPIDQRQQDIGRFVLTGELPAPSFFS